MTDEGDEWVTIKPGEGGARAPSAGPTASEWVNIPSPGRSTAPAYGIVPGMAREIGNTVTFGGLDRLRAAGQALTSDKTYSQALQEELGKSRQAGQEQGPFLRGTSQVIGALPQGYGIHRAIGGVVGAAGRPLMERVGRTALEGGIQGGLQGWGNTYSGIPSDYVHNAGMGTLLGAGIGAAAPAVGAAGSGLYRAAADRGWTSGIPRVVAEAAQADRAGLRNLPNIPGAMLPDAGPSMLGLAQGAVTGTGGPGKSTLTTNLRTRDAGTGQRIVGDIDQTFGPATTPSHVEQIVRQRMAALGPQYNAVFANARAIDNTRLARHLETQIIDERGPAQDALRQVRNMLDIPTNPGNLDPHPRALQATREAVRGMRDSLNIDDNTRRVLRDTYDRLTQELQTKVPGIREIDHQYAELGTQLRAALPTSPGAAIFDTSRTAVARPVELAQTMTEAAQPKGVNVGPSGEAFRLREAARNELDRIVGTNKNDLAKLESVLGQPQDWNQQKLAVMFGQERADRLMGVLARARQFRQTYQDVVQGSQTATRTAAKEQLEAGQGKIPWDTTLFGTGSRAAQGLWDMTRRGAADRQRDSIAQLMATRDPVRIQQLVDQMLAAQPNRDLRQRMTRDIIERGIVGAAGSPSIERNR